MIIEWKESWNTGIKEIDSQHERLVSILNKVSILIEAHDAYSDDDVIDQCLSDLLSYTIEHFDFEEKLMAQYNYEDLENHKKIHQDLREKVKDLYDQFSCGREVINEFLTFLQTWLVTHIQAVDRKYVPFLKNDALR